MNEAFRIIGNTCTYCAAAGFAALGVVTAATMVWVIML